MRVVGAALTDIGRIREGNEDAYLNRPPLWAVADGMGGHRGGEVASTLALGTLERLFGRGQGNLAEQIQEANQAVWEKAQQDRSVAGMGTTLTAVAVEERGRRLRLAHVGDSRAYLLRNGDLRMLTEDHTLVARMIEHGELTPAEAETHPQRSVLTRAVGVDPSVHVDEGTVEVAPGDRLLLCTDGLTAMVPEEQIHAILAAGIEPKEAATRLVRAANRAGGVDNITVVVLDFVEENASEPGPEESGGGGDGAPLASPSPTPPRAGQGRARLIRKIAVRSALAVAVVVLLLIGLRLYTDSQWFVGVSNERVAIYQGIPSEVLGFELHHVVFETQIPAEQAEALAFYSGLREGITVNGRREADELVERIETDLAAQQPRGAAA